MLGNKAKVGSVDKFQGQEAPIVILSMCASDAESSSRGMSFLLDKNRLNVAVSRSQAITIIVASDNDHVTSIERSKDFAKNWGSELIILENAGHIEPKSGFGYWSLALELIDKLENTTNKN